MACGHVGKLYPPGAEECLLADKERVDPLERNSSEDRVDLAAGAGIEDLHLTADGAGSGFQVSQRALRTR